MNILSKIRAYIGAAYLSGNFPPASSLFSRKKILVYYGFLGDKNFGDELVYESAKSLFSAYILLPVRKRMPLHWLIFSRIFKDRVAGLIIGGGTLIGPLWDEEYYMSLVRTGKPIFIHGTGVHKDIQREQEWKTILNANTFGGFRGPFSSQNAGAIVKTRPVIGDAAFYLFRGRFFKREPDDTNRRILINWGTHADYQGKSIVRQEMLAFIEILLAKNYSVDFLPLHAIDDSLGREVRERLPAVRILNIPNTFSEATAHFNNASFAIGERLHFTAMAILTGCDFLSVNYAAKHEDLLMSVGLSDMGTAPGAAHVEHMIDAMGRKGRIDWLSVAARLNILKDLQVSQAEAFLKGIRD